MESAEHIAGLAEQEPLDLALFLRSVDLEVRHNDKMATETLRELNDAHLRLPGLADGRDRDALLDEIRGMERSLELHPVRIVNQVTAADVYRVLMRHGGIRERKSLQDIGNIWEHPQVRYVTALDPPDRTRDVLGTVLHHFIREALSTVTTRIAAAAGTMVVDPLEQGREDRRAYEILTDRYARPLPQED
jgi:hypothetical protein